MKKKNVPPLRVLKYPKARVVRLSEQTDADLVTLATMADIAPAVLARQLIESGIVLVQQSADQATKSHLLTVEGLNRRQRRELERKQR